MENKSLSTRLGDKIKTYIAIGIFGILLVVTSPIHFVQSAYSTERYSRVATQYFELRNNLAGLHSRKKELENRIVESDKPEINVKLRDLYQMEHEELRKIDSVIPDLNKELSRIRETIEFEKYEQLMKRRNVRTLFQAGLGTLIMLGALLEATVTEKQKYFLDKKIE